MEIDDLYSSDSSTNYRYLHRLRFNLTVPDRLLAIEIKSGRKVKRPIGIEKFCQDFPNAKSIVLDKQLANTFMFSKNPFDLMIDFYLSC